MIVLGAFQLKCAQKAQGRNTKAGIRKEAERSS